MKQRLVRIIDFLIGSYSCVSAIIAISKFSVEKDGSALAFKILVGLFFLVLAARRRRIESMSSEDYEAMALFVMALVLGAGILMLLVIDYGVKMVS